jgi:hypothetical protein
MKRMLNSNPLEFEGLRHTKLVQRSAAQLRLIATDHEFVQQTVAQLPSCQNKERPPLTMEPSTDDTLAAVSYRINKSLVFGNTNSNRHTRECGYPEQITWIPAYAGMTFRKDGMLGWVQ